ncbi:MAG: PPC domain-containing protein [Chloroflexi bacterium]|nr:PPC domain-containing protein [Chloroflexota bacterium]
MRRQTMWRSVTVLMVMALVLLPVNLIHAQDDSRRLSVGQAVTGTLDSENFAETYIFDASAGDSATLTATTSSDTLSLALILSDPDGVVIASDGDLETATVATLAGVALETDGTYVVTVLRGTGADGDDEGEYTLALTGTITAPAASADGGTPSDVASGRNVYVQLDDGTIDVELVWDAGVDLDLEVRDPVGGALFWENPEVVSGGEHGGNVNQNCEDVVTEEPTETITWTSQEVPVGSYELLIYHINACGTSGPQQFTVNAAINGEDAQSFNGIINPGQVYLGRVTLDLDKDWTLFNGGVNAGVVPSVPADVGDISLGSTVSGTITNEDMADAYAFEGNTGESIEVNLDATSGSLDTLVILLDASGNRVADNDDGTDGTTNSQLTTILPNTGSYTLVATRYGQTIGGTEGNYSMSVNRPVSVPADNTGDGGTVDDQTDSTAVLPSGSIEVALRWANSADLQLLVRDPNGDSVFDDEVTIPSGGILNEVGNQNCVLATGNPVSYIYWPEGRTLNPGTYEVEVWYQSECVAGTPPPTFTLTIEVSGNTVFTTNQTPTLNTRYMVSFTVNQDGTVDELTDTDGGSFSMNDSRIIDVASNVATARPIDLDEQVQGTITSDNRFNLYSFEGRAGDRISISMTGTTGNLDSAVYLIGPAPSYIQLTFNDDAQADPDQQRDIDSRISSYTLQDDGEYYIIATHYGLLYGGTEGNYILEVTLLP